MQGTELRCATTAESGNIMLYGAGQWGYCPSASFSATISGTTITITGSVTPSGALITPGALVVNASNGANYGRVVSQLTKSGSDDGVAGTYTLSASSTVCSSAQRATAARPPSS
jgi:hypothetical protein